MASTFVSHGIVFSGRIVLYRLMIVKVRFRGFLTVVVYCVSRRF
ncbi:hypothetical protein THIOSC15_620004 [uncultured Thiomicrorhabdus sp.]